MWRHRIREYDCVKKYITSLARLFIYEFVCVCVSRATLSKFLYLSLNLVRDIFWGNGDDDDDGDDGDSFTAIVAVAFQSSMGASIELEMIKYLQSKTLRPMDLCHYVSRLYVLINWFLLFVLWQQCRVAYKLPRLRGRK